VRFPGIAVALVSLFSDRGRNGDPQAPHPTYNFDGAQAHSASRPLAGTGLHELSAGHVHPVTHDVRRRVQREATNEGDRVVR
jgi:hypothetical protein